jgi:gamma-glutamyltranspeptidase/glutathione hydrolase
MPYIHLSSRPRRPPLLLVLPLALLAAWGGARAEDGNASREGVVAAASPYAAQVGADLLARGGNAIDAATATAFTLVVAEPGMSGLGGRTVMLIGRPGGRVEALDGATAWPQEWIRLRREKVAVPRATGWKQVAVPGSLAAMVEAQRRWGSLPLGDVIRPAISLARTGFLVSRLQAQLFAEHDWKDDSAELRRIFLHPDGTPYLAGERLKQPDLAHTLELVAVQGSGVLYSGEIGKALVAQMEKDGGYVRLPDLAAYRPRTPQIDEVQYGDRRIVTMDRPTAGRSLLWRLRVLEKLPRYPDRVDDTQALSELLAAPLPDGPAGESDAAECKRLLSGDSVARTAQEIAAHVAARQSTLPMPEPAKITNTTHFTVADGKGTVVSVTQTLGPFFGPGVVLPGYGITFASTMGYLRDTNPSIQPTSSIVPTVVFDRTGTPEVGLGGAGAARIPGAVLQVLHHTLNQHTSLAEALALPRVTLDRDGSRPLLRMESLERPEMQSLAAALKARGIAVQPGQVLGRVHAVRRTADGAWEGAADPRWFGEAVTPVVLPAEGKQGRVLPQPGAPLFAAVGRG